MINKTDTMRALQFLRVLDDNNNLSLTNLALIAGTVKLLLTPQLATADLMMFVGSLASYQFKRWMTPTDVPADDNSALKAAIESLQTKVTSLQLGSQIKR